MEFHTCSLEVNFSKTFNVIDKDFQKYFTDALKAKPNFLAYDLDIDYDGIVGSTGIQITQDKISSGHYSVKKINDVEYLLESNCKINAEFMFMNEAGCNAFKRALMEKELSVSVCSVCNNGQNRKTFWSMECDPALKLNSNEFNFG
jgi:hypothetical protein